MREGVVFFRDLRAGIIKETEHGYSSIWIGSTPNIPVPMTG